MSKTDPYQERKRLADLYAGMADEELDKLLSTADELTDLAREALKEEIERRGGHVEYDYEEAGTEPEHPDLVTVAEFRDLQEALLACSMLKSAGIESFLADENTVRMNWFWSNMIGNMRLLVREEDMDAAQEILRQPVPEQFEVGEGEPAFRQPKCPKCGSLDIQFEGLDQGLVSQSPGSRFQCRCGAIAGSAISAGQNGGTRRKSQASTLNCSTLSNFNSDAALFENHEFTKVTGHKPVGNVWEFFLLRSSGKH